MPSFLGTKAPQTWPYTPLFIPHQRVRNLCVPNIPLTHGADIAGTYSAGHRLPWNHNLPEGRLRFWEPRHHNLGHIRHYSFHNRGYVTCVYQNSPLIEGSDIAGTYSAGSGLPWNHNLPDWRLRFWEPKHPKLGPIRHYSFHNRGYVTCVYQIALWPREPILLANTVQGLDCRKIIICQRDAFVSGNQGTPNLAKNATILSITEGTQPVCTN